MNHSYRMFITLINLSQIEIIKIYIPVKILFIRYLNKYSNDTRLYEIN